MSNYNVSSCDVLILGGGIGGLSCAVSLKKHNPEIDVLVVEKNFAGYAGKANRGGGVLQYFPDSVDPWGFAVFHAKNIGADFTDQALMARYVSQNSAMMAKLESWGVNIPRNADGSLTILPTGPQTAMICIDLDITVRVRRTAEKKGVRFMDKTVMAELLTGSQGVTGAVVFSVLDGTVTAISAKKVVLATGSQDYRIGSMWSSGRGDGIAAAYRAGAEMRNAEFGNFAQLARYRSHNEVVFGENYMYNSKGEHITRNFQERRETDISSRAIREWYKQVTEGNGPVYLDFGDEEAGENAMERVFDRPYGKKFRQLNDESGHVVDKDMEVAPLFIGEQSPIKVDHHMKTSLEGLYAIGDCSYCGSRLPGAVPAPPGRNRGSGILNAVFAALECADEVGEVDFAAASLAPIDSKQVAAAQARITDPMERKTDVTAKQVIALVQKAMAPVEQSVIMKQDRMEKALQMVEEAKALLPKMSARDLHGTMECMEAEAMVLSAEMHYRASMLRKESRGWFMREDYPEQDNVNWFKHIIVKNVNGEMTFSTEPVDTTGWIYGPEHTVIISDEVKNGPLYKYFQMDMKAPDPARYAAAAAPADPSKGLAPWDLNKLFEPGYLDLECGFCQMPDGGAMLANLTDMPDVTPEMFDFWFAWHGLEDGRYTIWDKEDHYSAVSREKAKGNDKSLSMKERYWDTTHDVFEDCGLGPERIIINFRNPADIGFDPEKLKDFKGTIVCSGNAFAPVIMCHFLRPKADGKGYELRSRFWFGYHIGASGKPEKMLPEGEQFSLIPVQALLAHNIKEFTNLADKLPQIYAEFGKDF